jgi:hypothetical protein
VLRDGIKHHSLQYRNDGSGERRLGGILGLGVDAATGAMNNYPDIVTVAMIPDPGVPAIGTAPASAENLQYQIGPPALCSCLALLRFARGTEAPRPLSSLPLLQDSG